MAIQKQLEDITFTTIAYCRQIVAVIILVVDNGNQKIEDPLSITTSPFHDLTCGDQTNWSFQEAKVNGVLKSL